MKALALALLLAVMSGNFCHAELVSASAPDGTPAALRLTVDAKAREADVLVDANRGGLRYYCQNTYQTLWLDGPALKALEAAAQKYNKQFEARALRRGKKATAACYVRSRQAQAGLRLLGKLPLFLPQRSQRPKPPIPSRPRSRNIRIPPPVAHPPATVLFSKPLFGREGRNTVLTTPARARPAVGAVPALFPAVGRYILLWSRARCSPLESSWRLPLCPLPCRRRSRTRAVVPIP